MEDMNLHSNFYLYFFNKDISMAFQVFYLKFSVCDPNIPLEVSMSPNFDLGLSFYFMSKNG